MFVDAILIWSSGKQVEKLKNRLQIDLNRIEKYASQWQLIFNTEKNVHSIFTSGRKALQHKVVLQICGKRLKWDRTPIYLGIKLNQKLQLHSHVRDLCAAAREKLPMVKNARALIGVRKQDY